MDLSGKRGRLSVKILSLDYYFASPISGIDQNYSSIRGMYASRLPIVRVYGTTPVGQKVCAHIHGVLPYFFVQFPNSHDGPVDDYLRNFCSSLECAARKNSAMHDMLVFSASLVTGRSIYGFNANESHFIKVNLLDPAFLSQCSELLLNGMVMSRSFQPLETHLPFLLKFCIDYNLYGMNYLHTNYFKIRASSSDRDVNESGLLDGIWHPGNVPSSQLLFPDQAPKLSSTDLEVDISAQDILNRLDLENLTDSNPGLEALWEEERTRRTIHTRSSSPLPLVPSPDHLLPLSKPGVIPLSESEVGWLERWEQLRLQLRLQSVESALQFPISDEQTNDAVTEWLQASEDSDAEEIQTKNRSLPDPASSQSTVLRKTSQSSQTASSASGQTSLSSVNLQELVRLAQATEEADAPVLQPNEPAALNWSFLNCTTDGSSLCQSTQQLNQIRASVSLLDPIQSHNYSQDLLASQSTMEASAQECSSCTTVQANQSPATSNNEQNAEVEEEEEDEALLVAHATRAALSFRSGQLTQSTREPLVETVETGEENYMDVVDDVTMSERVQSSADADLSIPDAFAVSLDEPFDEGEYYSHELVSLSSDPHPPAHLEHLEPVSESDECSSDSEDTPGSHRITSPVTSPQSSHATAEKSPSQEQPDATSQSLFSTWNPDDDSNPDDVIRQLLQLDGTADDDQSGVTSAPAPVQSRRRRLGLRLASTGLIQSSSSASNLSVHKTPRTRGARNVAPCISAAKCPRLSPNLEVSGAYNTTDDRSYSDSRAMLRSKMNSVGELERCTAAPDCESSSLPSQPSQLEMCPVVILERLNDPDVWQQSPGTPSIGSTDLVSNGRRSPVEEFEDLSVPPCSSETLPFEYDSLSSARTMPIRESQCSTLEQLTLFSETHLSSGGAVSPLPISPSDLPPCVQSHVSWAPTRPPPSRDSVVQWLRTRESNGEQHASTSDLTSDNSRSADELVGEGCVPHASQKQSESLSTPVEDAQTVLCDIDSSSPGRGSSATTISVLYQAASQRCFQSVQADHVTIASLELHCCVRIASQGANLHIDGSQIARASLRGGLLPDPSLDAICVACIGLHEPSGTNDMFVLINGSELPDPLLTDSPDPDKPAWMRWCSGFTTNNAANESGSKSRFRPSPRWIWCPDEWDVLNWVIYLTQRYDPELLVGYDVERASWGYLVDRATHLHRQSFARELSRLAPDIRNCIPCSRLITECGNLMPGSHTFTNHMLVQSNCSSAHCSCPCRRSSQASENPSKVHRSPGWPAGPGAGRTGGPFPCPGRIVLCLWRVLMADISLFEYSLETVVLRLLKKTVPKFSGAQLHQWFTEPSGSQRWRTIDYYVYRSLANLRLISAVDLVGRTSEFARVFGIEFYHVLSRGSQYRVESLLGRTARSANFLLPSPSVTQRARQRAPEAIPLNLEPDSRLFVDGPVAVLDFQSLYPSIVIAYNYCYSTVLGRFTNLVRGEDNMFDLGCLAHHLPTGLIESLGSNVTVSPNGVVFVNSSIREGILPRMLKQLLRARLMVKDSMKLYKSNKPLSRLLDSRQLGLKLMANVIFGYTNASFSGRMPCVEIGDSIVQKARETLERAISLVESGQIVLPNACAARVVYGDTDSLFVHLPGLGRLEAFEAAEAISEAVTAANPAPIKLKVEKIYYPCLLEAKKRYAGYAYETAAQTEPVFDAKGLETVRRDGCPFVAKMLEATLRLLFDQFPLPVSVQSDEGAKSSPFDEQSISQLVRTAESRVRDLVRMHAQRLLRGEIPFGDCILTRPYWGQASYRPGAFAPALQVARRLLTMDPRAEPVVGERVVYYIAPGRPHQTLISCIRAVSELCPPVCPSSGTEPRRCLSPRLNVAYYLDKQLIPPLVRMAQLLGWRVDLWLGDLPRFHTLQANSRYSILDKQGPSLKRLDSMDSQSSTLSQSSNLLSVVDDRPSGVLDQQQQRKHRHRRPHVRRRHPSSIMRAFVRQPLRICIHCDSRVPQTVQLDRFGCCQSCKDRNSRLSVILPVEFGAGLNRITQEVHQTELVCTGCQGHRSGHCDATWLCTNLLCPIQSIRLRATSHLAVFASRRSAQLTDMDSLLSW